MAFRRYKGKTKIVWLPMTTSLALTKGTLVELTSGRVAAADADEAATEIRGVLAKTIASTDADYASARLVPVEVPIERHVVWEADATGFTAGGTNEGVEYGISDSGTVDQTETTADAFLVTEVLSATKVRGFLKINGAY
jgi:hypothetical protein